MSTAIVHNDTAQLVRIFVFNHDDIIRLKPCQNHVIAPGENQTVQSQSHTGGMIVATGLANDGYHFSLAIDGFVSVCYLVLHGNSNPLYPMSGLLSSSTAPESTPTSDEPDFSILGLDEVEPVKAPSRAARMEAYNTFYRPWRTVILKSFHGNFLSGLHDRIALSPCQVENDHWVLLDLENGKFAFQKGDDYLKADLNGQLSYASEPKEWEGWKVIHAADGKVAFRSHHGKYLSARDDGTINCVQHLLEWECWSW